MTTLELSHVSAAFGQRTALDDLSGSFRAGELVAVLGPNGAGKSTLLRAIAGHHPTTGDIRLDGVPLAGLSLPARARKLGYLPQGHQTHWPLRVAEIVALGRFPHGATDPAKLTPEHRGVVDRAMSEAGVADLATTRATDLSGGERARVALARVLAQQTPVILADEPTASLDPRYQIEVMALLARIAREGHLVFAVLHDLDLAARFATRAVVLDGGRLAADASPDAALSDRLCTKVFGIRRAALHPTWDLA